MSSSNGGASGWRLRWSAVAVVAWISLSWIFCTDPGAHPVFLASLALLPAALVHTSVTYPSASRFARDFPVAIWAAYLVCAVPAVIGALAAGRDPQAASVLRATALGLSALVALPLIANLSRVASRAQNNEAIAARLGLAGLALSAAAPIAAAGWGVLELGVVAFPCALAIGAAWIDFRAAASARTIPAPDSDRPRTITLGDIGAELAHAMRKPLEAVSDQLGEALRRSPDSDDQKRLRDSMDLLSHMQDLINGVLDLARGQVGPKGRRLRLESLVAQAIAEVQRRFRDATIEVRSTDGVLDGDEVALRCVLVTLLENALEASAGVAWVRVSAERTGEWFEIAVEDRSGGLPERVRAHLFEPFVTTKARGIGLGLATVREACLAHGGHVEVAEIPNGTRFVVRLPAQAR